MTFWDFCSNHPITTVLIVIVIGATLDAVTTNIFKRKG